MKTPKSTFHFPIADTTQYLSETSKVNISAYFWKKKRKKNWRVNLNICTHTASKSIIIARNEGEQFLIPFVTYASQWAEIGIFTNIFRLVFKVEVEDPENDAELVPTAWNVRRRRRGISRRNGGRWLISAEDCINMKIPNLRRYASESNDMQVAWDEKLFEEGKEKRYV